MTVEEKMLHDLRRVRERVCFSIINRGALWYESLTDAQIDELREWYVAWLDVTKTFKIPKKPAWLQEKG